VALGRDIGVDVETVNRSSAAAEIAASFFARDEVLAIAALPAAQQQLAFTMTWTLKEAYIKACGLGLSIPLADFAIAVNPPRISFSPRRIDDDSGWLLWQDQPTPRHVLAVAARRQPDEQLRLQVLEVPLQWLISPDRSTVDQPRGEQAAAATLRVTVANEARPQPKNRHITRGATTEGYR
jgi:4'-phosphopantetheinyl transferase